jgi:hypothetical protein
MTAQPTGHVTRRPTGQLPDEPFEHRLPIADITP